MNLDNAVAALREANFDITTEPDGFSARWFDGPVLHLRAGTIGEARSLIVRMTSATLPAAIAACDACITIAFEDLDDALDEINTLIESQSRLQAACNGIVFLEWNANVQHPE
jgi:hypothetical protein